MARVDIYLKGGAVIALNIDDFTVELNGLNGIHAVKWKNGKDKPLYVRPEEIAAVIVR